MPELLMWTLTAPFRFVGRCALAWLELRYGGDDPEPQTPFPPRPARPEPTSQPTPVGQQANRPTDRPERQETPK